MLNELIASLAGKKWQDEVLVIEQIQQYLVDTGCKSSVRIVAKRIDKSKSYVGIALELSKGLRLYPELANIQYRHLAYAEYIRRKKLTSHLFLRKTDDECFDS